MSTPATPSSTSTGSQGTLRIRYLPSLTLVLLAACARQEAPARDCAGRPMPEMTASTSVRLDWEPPTHRTDGSVLEDLVGYRVYFGRSPELLGEVIEICAPAATGWVVTGLDRGTWYFALTAVDGGNIESERTGVVSRHLD